MKYIAKADGWFKEGTEVKFIDFILCGPENDVGLFSGIRVSEGEGIHKIGEEYLDEEVCPLDEFEEVTKSIPNRLLRRYGFLHLPKRLQIGRAHV